ncbi:MAG: hypothetical protein GY749_26480 [Desulfobacteraceae bacterium]|nr:hypothetical protein [Desulfobacteraceae bacterium]
MLYYKYLKIMKKYGEEGLRDKRGDGNYTKLTPRIKDYIVTACKENPGISSTELQGKIRNHFNTDISKPGLNAFRKTEGLTGKRIWKERECELQRSGGGEIITGLAFFFGITDLFTRAISERADEVRQSPLFQNNKSLDHPACRVKGKFTKEYNQLKSVRKNRFRSVGEKIPKKNYASMNIFRMSEKVISRYNLALLCLPLVTSNGKSSRVNRVRGNDLAFLCGYNYKDATLDKYLRDLKYLKVSEKLISETAKFWMNFWRNRYEDEIFFVCYYIDGNTNALWSSRSHYKGKVTMPGRVMNCVENVFVHDGKGHPICFQTFHGHADLGRNALRMLTELMKHFEQSDHVSVRRILVIDGGGNSVRTMRSFHGRDEYFITIPDANQTEERKFKNKRETESYKYGGATLSDCQIELKDSSEKNYVYETRAVIVKWDNGRRSVLVTDIPRELSDASEITKRYFDRWPMQEKQFRDAKNGVNIHRIVGYGRKSENYDKMREKHRKLVETICRLESKLKEPLKEVEKAEKILDELYRKERRFREKSSVDDSMSELKECEREIDRYLRWKRRIEKEHKDDFKKLRKNMNEEKRIRNKDKVYRIDTELDQIMTCFKLSFANICSLFLSECMNNERFEIRTLFESVFRLEGNAVITDGEKTIRLAENPKEPELMQKLTEAITKLNTMKMADLEGRRIQFSIQIKESC